MADVVSELPCPQIEVSFPTNVHLRSLLQGAPTVSQLHSFAGEVDDGVRVVGIDPQGCDSFGGDCLDYLPRSQCLLDNVLQVGMVAS